MTTGSGVQSGNAIPVEHALSDRKSRPVDAAVELRLDENDPFQPATPAPGSDPLAGVATSPAGEPYLFLWNSVADGVVN